MEQYVLPNSTFITNCFDFEIFPSLSEGTIKKKIQLRNAKIQTKQSIIPLLCRLYFKNAILNFTLNSSFKILLLEQKAEQ